MVDKQLKSFKEKWEEEDILCPHCKQVTSQAKGITRQNIKRLLIPKFNMNELVFTIIILLMIILAVSYRNETAQSREWIKSMTGYDKTQCESICVGRCQLYWDPDNMPANTNLSNISVARIPFILNELNETNSSE